MKRKILVALQTFSEYSETPLKLLESSGADIILNKLGHRLTKEEIIQLGKDCEGVIAGVEPYDEEVLNKMSNLKCISRAGVGIDNIDLQVAEQRKITILNTPEVIIQPVTEITVAMIFDLLRLLTFHTNKLRSGNWEKKAGHLLKGRKVGIVGLGRIGKKVGETLKLLGAEVAGYDISPDNQWAKKNNITLKSLKNLLEESDILTLHVSLLDENKFYMGEDEIFSMKKGSILINTSRGQITDEDALYKALKLGHLGGAGLDVYKREPYKGPLIELNNVVLTPHVATLTVESRTEMEKEAVQNLLGFFNPS